MIKNYQILKEHINYIISQSGLDIGVVYFIMKDILSNLAKMYYDQIDKECLEEAQQKEKSDASDKENNEKTD